MNTVKTEGFSGTAVQGLTYSCNGNTSNRIDFCVLTEGGEGGIRPQQGSPTLPAGNTFGGVGYHFYNDGDSIVNYYYNGSATGQTPDPSKLYRVNRTFTNASQTSTRDASPKAPRPPSSTA